MYELEQQQLLKYLAQLGFDGQELARKLATQFSTGTRDFSARHKINVGDQTIYYDLQFTWEQQFNSYRLTGYDTTLRHPVLIDHEALDGFDLEAFEMRMSELDWEQYFKVASPQTDELKQTGKAIIEDLDLIRVDYWSKGPEIAQLLMYKYWPKAVFLEMNDRSDLVSQYEKQRHFKMTDEGIANAKLAYLYLTDVIPDLFEQINQFGIAADIKAKLYRQLEPKIQDMPERIELKTSHHLGNIFCDVTVPVRQVADKYVALDYELVVRKLPQINHGTYDGIDTAALEQTMLSINWKADRDLYLIRDNFDLTFRLEVSDVISALEKLRKSRDGKAVADLLELKYWADAGVMETLINDNAWKLFNALPVNESVFQWEMPLDAMINLLSGKQVKEHFIYPSPFETNVWLAWRKAEENSEELFIATRDFGAADMMAAVRQIPIANEYDPKIMEHILELGDMVPVTLKNGKEVYLAADPTAHTVRVFTPLMKEIPVNLHFDPEWKSNQSQKNEQSKTKRRRLQQKPLRRGRSSGLW